MTLMVTLDNCWLVDVVLAIHSLSRCYLMSAASKGQATAVTKSFLMMII
jgi:hypothetical protein